MKNIINIKDLNYKIFNNFNLFIEKNSLIALSGPNNCGKTTLMRILNGEKERNIPIEILGKGLNDYKLGQYGSIIQSLFPLEVCFQGTNLEEELKVNEINITDEKNNYIIKGLNIKRILRKKYMEMSTKEIILCQLSLVLLKRPKIILIDELSSYMDYKDIINIIKFLKTYQREENITIIYTTVDLEEIIDFDYLYIINNGQLLIEGKPLEVLQNDNLLNRIGLKIPFMIDLSVKLKDYELVSDIEITPEGMVDRLWK